MIKINSKGRPSTQCSHCKEARKNNNLHTQCTCGSKKSKSKSKSAKSKAKEKDNGDIQEIKNSSGINKSCKCDESKVCVCKSKKKPTNNTSPPKTVPSSLQDKKYPKNISILPAAGSNSDLLNNTDFLSSSASPSIFQFPTTLNNYNKTDLPISTDANTSNISMTPQMNLSDSLLSNDVSNNNISSLTLMDHLMLQQPQLGSTDFSMNFSGPAPLSPDLASIVNSTQPMTSQAMMNSSTFADSIASSTNGVVPSMMDNVNNNSMNNNIVNNASNIDWDLNSPIVSNADSSFFLTGNNNSNFSLSSFNNHSNGLLAGNGGSLTNGIATTNLSIYGNNNNNLVRQDSVASSLNQFGTIDGVNSSLNNSNASLAIKNSNELPVMSQNNLLNLSNTSLPPQTPSGNNLNPNNTANNGNSESYSNSIYSASSRYKDRYVSPSFSHGNKVGEVNIPLEEYVTPKNKQDQQQLLQQDLQLQLLRLQQHQHQQQQHGGHHFNHMLLLHNYTVHNQETSMGEVKQSALNPNESKLENMAESLEIKKRLKKKTESNISSNSNKPTNGDIKNGNRSLPLEVKPDENSLYDILSNNNNINNNNNNKNNVERLFNGDSNDDSFKNENTSGAFSDPNASDQILSVLGLLGSNNDTHGILDESLFDVPISVSNSNPNLALKNNQIINSNSNNFSTLPNGSNFASPSSISHFTSPNSTSVAASTNFNSNSNNNFSNNNMKSNRSSVVSNYQLGISGCAPLSASQLSLHDFSHNSITNNNGAGAHSPASSTLTTTHVQAHHHGHHSHHHYHHSTADPYSPAGGSTQQVHGSVSANGASHGHSHSHSHGHHGHGYHNHTHGSVHRAHSVVRSPSPSVSGHRVSGSVGGGINNNNVYGHYHSNNSEDSVSSFISHNGSNVGSVPRMSLNSHGANNNTNNHNINIHTAPNIGSSNFNVNGNTSNGVTATCATDLGLMDGTNFALFGANNSNVQSKKQENSGISSNVSFGNNSNNNFSDNNKTKNVGSDVNNYGINFGFNSSIAQGVSSSNASLLSPSTGEFSPDLNFNSVDTNNVNNDDINNKNANASGGNNKSIDFNSLTGNGGTADPNDIIAALTGTENLDGLINSRYGGLLNEDTFGNGLVQTGENIGKE